MTKSELIQRLAEANPHLYLRDVERIVTTIFDEITDALAQGDRVELRGFGAFSVKERGSRMGRNRAQRRRRRCSGQVHSVFQNGQAASRKTQRQLICPN